MYEIRSLEDVGTEQSRTAGAVPAQVHKTTGFSECILWPYAAVPPGYGRLAIKGKVHHVTRLSATLFHGEPPIDKPYAAHGPCHNPACFNPHHLHWSSNAENQADRVRDRTADLGEKNHRSKLTAKDVLAIRASKESKTKLASIYKVDSANIRSILARKTWKHV